MARRTDAAVFDHTDEPPVAVAIVQEHHSISFCRIRLALDRGDEGVQGVNELEIDVLCDL